MRLIDADELVKRFKELKGTDSLANLFITDVIKEIKKKPTAYDVDKVVERLEELTQNEIKLLCEHESDTKDMQAMRGHNILQDAIKIVKSGGIE